MIIAFVLGNGTSRLKISTLSLREQGLLIGCNRAYRDHNLDVVCAVDQPMIYEITQSSAATLFTDSRHSTTHPANQVIDTSAYNHIDSGTLALLASQHLGATVVFMLGYDYISYDGLTNNVYAGEPNYNLHSNLHVDRSVIDIWEHNHNQVFNNHPQTQFLRINTNDYIPGIVAPNFHNITEQQFRDTFARK